MIQHIEPETVAAYAQKFAASESVGQQRQTALHSGDKDKLVIAPNLWAGVGLVRGGAGATLVGSPEDIAARLKGQCDVLSVKLGSAYLIVFSFTERTLHCP